MTTDTTKPTMALLNIAMAQWGPKREQIKTVVMLEADALDLMADSRANYTRIRPQKGILGYQDVVQCFGRDLWPVLSLDGYESTESILVWGKPYAAPTREPEPEWATKAASALEDGEYLDRMVARQGSLGEVARIIAAHMPDAGQELDRQDEFDECMRLLETAPQAAECTSKLLPCAVRKLVDFAWQAVNEGGES